MRKLGLLLLILLPPLAAYAVTPGGGLGVSVDPSNNLAFLRVDSLGRLLLSGSGPGLAMITPGGQTGIALDPNNNFAFLHVDSNGGLITSGGGSGSGAATQQTITQSNSFTVQEVVAVNPSNTWVAAESNSGGVTNGFGIVTAATGSSFTVVTSGLATGLSGLVPGTTYFISDSTPGLLTSVAPTNTSSVYLAVGTAASSSTLNVGQPIAASLALIPNVSLANSAVTIGGISVSLGGSLSTAALNQGATPGASALTESTGATTINWATSNTFTLTLNANLTSVTFSNSVSGQTIIIAVTNTASNYAVTWGNSIKWVGGSQPTQTTGAHTDVWTIIDVGGTYYGSVVQNF